jgi:hypothetical protein
MAFRIPRAPRRTKLAATIARELANVLPTVATHIQASMQPPTPVQKCDFKHFKSVNPPTFDGTGNATLLLVWFDEMENAFLNSDCPEDLKTRHSTAYLRDHALAWWNSEKLHRGNHEAYALSWAELKEIMLEEYCPENEIENLEREF